MQSKVGGRWGLGYAGAAIGTSECVGIADENACLCLPARCAAALKNLISALDHSACAISMAALRGKDSSGVSTPNSPAIGCWPHV